ncbi:hypothetical protein ACE6H2_014531 [Prunus campanulata]
MGRKATKPSPKIPSFFKALVGDFSHCLSIPPKFMNYVDARLPPTCTLRGPSGECWTVGLELRGDRFVFHKGWQGKSGKRIATDGGKEISNAHVVFRSKHPCFIGAMTKNHYRLNIPKALAVAKGLIRKKSVKVEDPNGISWDVKLRLDGKEHRGGRLFMT